MDENKEFSPLDLFLAADKKIDTIREDTEKLMIEDLDLKHKMDLVIQRQDQLKERFEHSSSTGHKTWELVQKIAGEVTTISTRQTLVEDKAKSANELAEKVDKRFDRFIVGLFVTVFSSVLVAVVVYLLKR